MMLRRTGVAAFRTLIIVVALGTPAILRAQNRPAACYPQDSVATRFLAWGKLLGSGTDSSVIQARRLLQVPVVPASGVVTVTDTLVCGKLAGAYSTAVSAQVTQVYAIKIGQVFAAFDPAVNGGEWNIVVTFDSKYRKLGSALH